ncbi:MAG: hypothetical protein QM706_01170 [Nitrospira sp.]
MRLTRSTSLFGFTLWSLLATWMFFGCLELIEESQIIPAITEEAQEGEDYDAEALAQLASGLKSDLFDVGTLSSIQILSVLVQPTVTLSTSPARPCVQLVRHGPASLPLYQQLSVYRI